MIWATLLLMAQMSLDHFRFIGQGTASNHSDNVAWAEFDKFSRIEIHVPDHVYLCIGFTAEYCEGSYQPTERGLDEALSDVGKKWTSILFRDGVNFTMTHPIDMTKPNLQGAPQ